MCVVVANELNCSLFQSHLILLLILTLPLRIHIHVHIHIDNQSHLQIHPHINPSQISNAKLLRNPKNIEYPALCEQKPEQSIQSATVIRELYLGYGVILVYIEVCCCCCCWLYIFVIVCVDVGISISIGVVMKARK